MSVYDTDNRLLPLSELLKYRPYREGFTYEIYKHLLTGQYAWINSPKFAEMMGFIRSGDALPWPDTFYPDTLYPV